MSILLLSARKFKYNRMRRKTKFQELNFLIWSRWSQKRRTNRFFLLSWSVMQNTRQQRIHDLNFTLRHHKNYVIKGQFVCLLYADFENYSKHINIVTSFLSIIMQHTVFKYQLKKSHSILWAKRATFTKIAKISKIAKIAKISK